MPTKKDTLKNKKTVKAVSKGKDIAASLEQLSSTHPIPFDTSTGWSYFTDQEYLPFLGREDNYGKLILQSRLLSCTHNACIITKKDYCAGRGFQTIDESDISNKKFMEWLKCMNVHDQGVNTINKKLFESHFTFGNTPVELVRFSVGKKKYLYIYIHNFLEWRLLKPDGDGVIHGAIHSKLFLKDNVRMTEEDFKNSRVLPLYKPRNGEKSSSKFREGINWLKVGNTERTIIWYKNETSGFDHYGVPSSSASLLYQILEYKGGRFNLDNFDNNMIISAILALKGNVSQTELNKIGKKVVGTHTGDGKRGRVMVVGSEQGIDGSDLHTLDTHKEGSYKASDENWTQKIILANQWDAILAGLINVTSAMGKGVGFLTKIMEVKKNTVIIPAQQDLVENVWVRVINIANDWLGFNIDPTTLQIKNVIDVSGLTDVDLTPCVTVDEVREGKGLPKAKDKKKGKMFLGELGADQKRGVYVKDEGKKKDPDEKEEEVEDVQDK